MVVGAISTLVVASVEQDRTGVAAGVNMVSRAIGGALGAPVATALITASVGVTDEYGYRVAFGVFTIAAAAVALVSAFVPFGQPSRTAGDHQGDSRKARRAGGGRGDHVDA
jgi:MFS family permease